MDHGSRLILAYADAQGALERLEERRRLSPVRRPWRIRTLIAERQALARIDNSPIDDQAFTIDGRGAVLPSAFDLSHWRQAIGAPITLDMLLNDGLGVMRWLGIVAANGMDAAPALRSGRSPEDILPAIALWQQAAAALPPSPPLLQSAQLFHLWQRHAPIGHGDLVASLLVGDRWGPVSYTHLDVYKRQLFHLWQRHAPIGHGDLVASLRGGDRWGPGRWLGSAGGLIALGLDNSSVAWRQASGERLDMIWLEAIAAGAHAHLDLETRLRAYAWRAAQHIEQRRRPGRLKDVLRLAMTHPRISSGSVAKAVGLTSAGAIKLLAIAESEGLLIEQSGQASYRSYALPINMKSIAARRPPQDWLIDDFWSDEPENTASPEPL
ncbi:hypothetical protein [Sphingobium sp. B2]|uniref:hypothetical protein n=1 Tax=Sphingobium sp. B2 TaxID=2583228 RepID=UPI0021BD64A0|nr:hypothetical protein [Sphingobium sp. B2]